MTHGLDYFLIVYKGRDGASNSDDTIHLPPCTHLPPSRRSEYSTIRIVQSTMSAPVVTAKSDLGDPDTPNKNVTRRKCQAGMVRRPPSVEVRDDAVRPSTPTMVPWRPSLRRFYSLTVAFLCH